jgi:hypothetical protein
MIAAAGGLFRFGGEVDIEKGPPLCYDIVSLILHIYTGARKSAL